MDTCMFCTSNWMTRYKTYRKIFTINSMCRSHHIPFGTSDIGNDGVFRNIGLNRFKHFLCRANGQSQND
ncbi:hypothetical protein D3C75_1149540 [compost metagenome]